MPEEYKKVKACWSMVRVLEGLANLLEEKEWLKKEYGVPIVRIPKPEFLDTAKELLEVLENDFTNIGCDRYRALFDRFVSAREKIERFIKR